MQNKRKKHKPAVSQLIASPTIGSHHILRDDAAWLLVINHERSVKFSETQYRALKPLLSGGGMANEDLLEEVYGESAAMVGRESLNELIKKIRDKLRPIGLTVLSIEQCGYVLLPIPKRSTRGKGEG